MFGIGKKPAQKALDKIKEFYTKKGIKYELDEENSRMSLKYKGNNFNSLIFSLIVDEDGTTVAFRTFSIMQLKESELAAAYEFCNRMNCMYRWVRFYIDSDNELTAAMDAVVDMETIGEECYQLLARMVSIVDGVLGELK